MQQQRKKHNTNDNLVALFTTQHNYYRLHHFHWMKNPSGAGALLLTLYIRDERKLFEYLRKQELLLDILFQSLPNFRVTGKLECAWDTANMGEVTLTFDSPDALWQFTKQAKTNMKPAQLKPLNPSPWQQRQRQQEQRQEQERRRTQQEPPRQQRTQQEQQQEPPRQHNYTLPLTTLSFYDVLGVPENATNAEVRKAYMRMSLQHHPDKVEAKLSKAHNMSKAEKDAFRVQANQKFQEIGNAYEVLGDQETRSLYDSNRYNVY